MPFRYANPYGGYDFPAFPATGGFDFIDYDAVADPLMSPYDTFPLANPPDVAWTPASQSSEPQLSDSLSPLELNFGPRNSASPRDGTNQESPLDEKLSLGGPVAAPSATSPRSQVSRPGPPTTQQPFSDMEPHQPPRTAVAQSWDDGSRAAPFSTSMNPLRVAESTDNQSTSPSTAVPSRLDSVESTGETIDSKTSDPSRVRTTDSAKVRHNIVERRYRENINAQVDVLRDSIVATMQVKDEQNGTSSSRLGADELKRLTKAAVIAAATQQIKRARSENDKLLDEHRLLQAQIKELESMVKCGECPLMQLSVDMGLESPT